MSDLWLMISRSTFVFIWNKRTNYLLILSLPYNKFKLKMIPYLASSFNKFHCNKFLSCLVPHKLRWAKTPDANVLHKLVLVHFFTLQNSNPQNFGISEYRFKATLSKYLPSNFNISACWMQINTNLSAVHKWLHIYFTIEFRDNTKCKDFHSCQKCNAEKCY